MRRTILIGLLLPALAGATEAVTLMVGKLATPPTVDGKLDEWGADGWTTVPVHPAVKGDKQNLTGTIEVTLKTGVVGDRFYLAARWPDADANTDYKPWQWEEGKYKRSKIQDDMFALRFQMDKSYEDCMFSKTEYRVDVWLWSAGRSNGAGVAEDFMHILSTKPVENSAEYEMPDGGGIVYIRKPRDDGESVYENTKPAIKKYQGDILPGIALTNRGAGSAVDVTAKGVWAEGYWNLEFSRLLDTGHPDDRVFHEGDKIPGAIAVFDKVASEHKSVSDRLIFDFKP